MVVLLTKYIDLNYASLDSELEEKKYDSLHLFMDRYMALNFS